MKRKKKRIEEKSEIIYTEYDYNQEEEKLKEEKKRWWRRIGRIKKRKK